MSKKSIIILLLIIALAAAIEIKFKPFSKHGKKAPHGKKGKGHHFDRYNADAVDGSSGSYVGSDGNTYEVDHYQIDSDGNEIEGDDGNAILDPDFGGTPAATTPVTPDNIPDLNTGDNSGDNSGGDNGGEYDNSGDNSGGGYDNSGGGDSGGGGGGDDGSPQYSPTQPITPTNVPPIPVTPATPITPATVPPLNTAPATPANPIRSTTTAASTIANKVSPNLSTVQSGTAAPQQIAHKAVKKTTHVVKPTVVHKTVAKIKMAPKMTIRR